MINNDFIATELGVAEPFPESLLEVSTKFTMAFYYSENMFFSRDASTRRCRDYSLYILSIINDVCSEKINDAFDYFKERYTSSEGSLNRLYALTMESDEGPKRLSIAIENDLLEAKGDLQRMLAVCLAIIIRLRHNLLHANKYEAMMNSPNEQEELLSSGYELMASLLRASNSNKK